MRSLQAVNQFLAGFPRFSLEALGMITIAVLGYRLAVENDSSNFNVITLGGIALASQRLLPALQQTYGGWAQLKGFSRYRWSYKYCI